MNHEDRQTVNETFGYENSFFLGFTPPPQKKPSHPNPQSTPLPGPSTTAARDTRGTAKRNN